MNNNSTSPSGFTLIEILIVTCLLAILTTLGYFVTVDFYKSYIFNGERDTIVSLLERARAQALSNINQSPHGVHFDPSGYTLFQGSGYDEGAPSNQNFPASPGIIHSGINDVVFIQLSGDSLTGGSLNLSDGKRAAVISINPVGQINW